MFLCLLDLEKRLRLKSNLKLNLLLKHRILIMELLWIWKNSGFDFFKFRFKDDKLMISYYGEVGVGEVNIHVINRMPKALKDSKCYSILDQQIFLFPMNHVKLHLAYPITNIKKPRLIKLWMWNLKKLRLL